MAFSDSLPASPPFPQPAQGDGRPAASVVRGICRLFALTFGRALSLALLVEQGQWSLDYEHDGYSERGEVTSPYATAPLPPVVSPGVTVIEYGYEGQRPYYPYPPPRPHWR